MITARHLTKRYGSTTAVADVSFTAEPGRVTGFLGPNGAGKSTTLRMLCGLTRPTSGTVEVLGRPFVELPEPGRHVGILLDAAAQHAGRTGHETLLLSARMLDVPDARVGAVLEQVGLTAREARARTRTYSLGMRQRLGVAQALLGEPQVLVLDEPANGLDPAGIRWMRDLLHGFATDGGTVLVSSHLLREMEAVCDDIVIIGRGTVLAHGSAAELFAAPGTYVRSTDDAALAQALTVAGHEVTRSTDGSLSTPASAVDVGRVALAEGVVLTELRAARTSGLEELFFDMTAQHGREEVAA